MRKQFIKDHENFCKMRLELGNKAIDIIRSFALDNADSYAYLKDYGIRLETKEVVEGVYVDDNNFTMVDTKDYPIWIVDVEGDDIIKIAKAICEHEG